MRMQLRGCGCKKAWTWELLELLFSGPMLDPGCK